MTDREADAYERELGEEARARQQRDRRERLSCCGELVVEGHHFACPKRPDDEPPAHVEGQETLL